VILLAGIVMAVLLLPNVSALSEPYGELLIAKVVGFAVLMGLAAANKWRLGPALAHGPVSGLWFRRSVAAEYVLIAAVLAITAVMTSFFSPEA
jgi:putative copper export protein